MPIAIIIAGPNGAGKTTFANAYQAAQGNTFAFVNADEIAKGLPNVSHAARSIQAGRVLIRRLGELVDRGADFILETTLASRRYMQAIPRWREAGYQVDLIFLRLPSADAAIVRVARRVAAGGHHVPDEDVRRRFQLGLGYLPFYCQIVDNYDIRDVAIADAP